MARRRRRDERVSRKGAKKDGGEKTPGKPAGEVLRTCGKKVEYYGPIYQGHKTEGDKIRVIFTHVGQGLAFKHGDKLQGFAIAGADKKFVWADAAIDGDTVVLSSALVTEPMAVRYAWSQTHPWANLFNRDGLPALSFRTDTWEK